jgi:hypothetical protein
MHGGFGGCRRCQQLHGYRGAPALGGCALVLALTVRRRCPRLSACLAGSYSLALAAVCSPCPTGSSSGPAAGTCTCLAGYASAGVGASLTCTRTSMQPPIRSRTGDTDPQEGAARRASLCGRPVQSRRRHTVHQYVCHTGNASVRLFALTDVAARTACPAGTYQPLSGQGACTGACARLLLWGCRTHIGTHPAWGVWGPCSMLPGHLQRGHGRHLRLHVPMYAGDPSTPRLNIRAAHATCAPASLPGWHVPGCERPGHLQEYVLRRRASSFAPCTHMGHVCAREGRLYRGHL